MSFLEFASVFHIGNLKKVFKLEIRLHRYSRSKPVIHRQLLHLQPFMDFTFFYGGRQIAPGVVSEFWSCALFTQFATEGPMEAA